MSQLVDDVFNVDKIENKILSENISSALQIIQQDFSKTEYNSIACLLTDKISLDKASQLSGIKKSCISRYRNLKNKNKIFIELKEKKINENFRVVLDAWGDVNVMTTSGKSQKRMPQKCWKENYEHFLGYYKNKTEEEVGPSFEWFKKQVKQRRWLRSNYDRYRCSICYLGKEAKKLKYQLQQTDENVMIVLDKNGLENRKKIGDVIKDEEEHIETVKCITKVWKQIYDSLSNDTVIFCHDNSTVHESNSTKVRWCNISMRYRKDDGMIQTLRFDYLTKNKNSTTLVLLAWDLFLTHDVHYIPLGTKQIWIYSDSHERNNMHVYVMDMIQRRLNINVTYVSLPPHHGHNICDGHFAHGKQKLRSMVVNSGVKCFSQVIAAVEQVATTIHIVNYEKELEQPKKKIIGILKYFGFMFAGDGKLQMYDQNLKFYEPLKRVVDLDQNYRTFLDNYTNS